jgi:hypothetical protein
MSRPVTHFEIGCRDLEAAGTFAWFRDPEGNLLGLWQSTPPSS